MRTPALAISNLVLGLLVGVALGGGVGFLLGTGRATDASSEGGTAPLMQRADSSQEVTSILPGPEADLGSIRPLPDLALRRDEGAGGAGLSASEVARAERAAASALRRVASATLDDTTDATGVITGTVVNELGVVLAGVTVVSQGAQPTYSGRPTARTTEAVGRGFAGIQALDEELGDYAESRLMSHKKTRLAVTDEAGAFTLDGLEEGTHLIQGFLEDHAFEPAYVDTGYASRLVGNRVGAFELDVRLPDGTQPHEAIVMALGDDDSNERVIGQWTPAEPIIRFSSAKVRCRVLAGDPRRIDWREIAAEFRSALTALDLDSDGPGPHAIPLELETQLRVTVVDRSFSVPSLDPWVKARALRGGDAKAVPLKRYRNGPFILTGLEPGTFEVTAGRGRSAPESTEILEVGAGLHGITITLGDLDAGRFLVVRCTATDGTPVTSVEFAYKAVSSSGSRHGSDVEAMVKSPGEYWIDQSALRRSFQPSSEIRGVQLTAKSAVMGQMTKEVELSASSADFVFALPGEVTVEVTGALSETLHVDLVPSANKGDDPGIGWIRRRRAVRVDGAGMAHLGAMQPGPYELELSNALNDFDRPFVLASLPVVVKGGGNRFSLVAPALSKLVVHAPEIEEGTQFSLQRLGTGDQAPVHVASRTLNHQHRVRFKGVLPGRYMIRTWDETQQLMEVTVPCGEVLFVADEVNGFEVTRIQGEKAAKGAGLQNGDVILAVNGHRVDGEGFLNRFWVELAGAASTIQVRRGDSEVSIQMEKLVTSGNYRNTFGATLVPRSLEGL